MSPPSANIRVDERRDGSSMRLILVAALSSHGPTIITSEPAHAEGDGRHELLVV